LQKEMSRRFSLKERRIPDALSGAQRGDPSGQGGHGTLWTMNATPVSQWKGATKLGGRSKIVGSVTIGGVKGEVKPLNRRTMELNRTKRNMN